MQGTNYRLIVRRGPQPNQIYELNKGIITIGRDITNDIVINDPECSRHHCRLTQGGGGYTVEDLGSTNGTFINGQRLAGARPLSNGDMLGMGETVTLAYEMLSAGMPAAGPGQAATMVGPSSMDYAQPPRAGYDYNQQRPAQPSQYAQPQQQYGAPAQQQPMAYEYDYQEEPYEGGAGRWVVLGCGCFLVLCIVSSIIAGIIIDMNCWWDDIPVISDMFNLGVDPNADCAQ
jgi:pSer/pThr/pTyr-binding forkhead associated (FHA) protein